MTAQFLITYDGPFPIRNVEHRCIIEDFYNADLTNVSFENAELGRSDFLGASLRDTNLRSANLTNALFLTQMQVNRATGNAATRLPVRLTRPSHWPVV